MDILKIVKTWVGALSDLAVSVLAMMFVLGVLFKGTPIPFLGGIDVVANVTSVVKGLSSEGLLGLVAMWVLYGIWKSK
jgi:hypothetical protein